jgi:hypothetical protein
MPMRSAFSRAYRPSVCFLALLRLSTLARAVVLLLLSSSGFAAVVVVVAVSRDVDGTGLTTAEEEEEEGEGTEAAPVPETVVLSGAVGVDAKNDEFFNN